MPSESCGRVFSLALCACALPAGHKGHHRRSDAERRIAIAERHRRFYKAHTAKLVEKQRARRRIKPMSTYQRVLASIRGVERGWRLRLDGKIRRMDGKIVAKPLERGECERVRVEMRRVQDRYRNAPATAFLRLPRIAA